MHRNSVFLVSLPEAGLYTLWLRVQTDNVKAVTPVLWKLSAISQQARIKTMVAGLLYGLLICVSLAALVLGLAVARPIFLMCAGYFFLSTLTLFIDEGWLSLFLPGLPVVADMLSGIALALVMPLFVTVFSRLLLAEDYWPRLFGWYQRIIWGLAALAALAVLLLMAGYFEQVAPLVLQLAMLQLLLIVALALWVVPRQPSVRWVLFALIPVLPLGLLRLARNVGFDTYNTWLDTSMSAGMALHALVLLFFVTRHVALAYQSNLNGQAQLLASSVQLNEQRDFIALLSHEFRNPLFVMDSALSNLARQPLDSSTSARLNRMGRAAERLKYVLSYCLADERLATLASAQPPRSVLTAAQILEESLQQLDDDSQRLQLLTATAGQAELDAARVLGDLPLLGAALKNLLDNALKYAVNGLVELSVQVQAGQMIFRVRDHGPGLDEQASSRLFEKFTRGSHQQNSPGAGLGLYLSRKIVQQHGGEIRMRNVSGGGAIAELFIPLEI